jgi:hypothetical protein
MTTAARKRYNINQSPLYKLRNKKKLASILKVPSLQSLKAITCLVKPYTTFNVTIKGKLKSVEVPSRELYPIHARLFNLLTRIESPDYLHSGIKGRSYITNAKAHRGLKKAYTLDVVRFYPSISRRKVAAFFRDTMKCSKDVAAVLSDLSTYDDHIPTGSPLSQRLAYLTCKKMFDEVYEVSLGAKVLMTCYVDDLTFSGDNVSRRWIYDTIKRIITKHGFKTHKDRFFGPDRPKEITGVIVDGNKLKVCNRHHKAIYDLILEIPKNDDIETVDKLYDRLIGKLSAAAQIEGNFKKRIMTARNCRLCHPAKRGKSSTTPRDCS